MHSDPTGTTSALHVSEAELQSSFRVEAAKGTNGKRMHTATLFLGGDVMTGRGIDQILPRPSDWRLFERMVHDAREYVALAEHQSGPIPHTVDARYIWGDALEELDRVKPDARIINLETSVTRSNDPWPHKAVRYRMHPANTPCLTSAGIHVCILANNHVMDWGRAGLVETIETLHAAGIKSAGAGRSLAEAWQPAIVESVRGTRFVIIGLGDPSSGIPPEWAATERSAGVALLEDFATSTADKVAETIQRHRGPGSIAVASIHWGPNWGYDVAPSHARFAHALIDRGIDIVHGHSSHHPRPIEIYRKKLILYGCGDFIDDYEGIAGYEEFRDDLALMYFPTVHPGSGELIELRMVGLRIRKMRLERVSRQDAGWLHAVLGRESRPHGTKIIISNTNDLLVSV